MCCTNRFIKIFIWAVVYIGNGIFIKAQTPVNIKIEPQVSLSWKLNNRWDINGKLSGMQYAFSVPMKESRNGLFEKYETQLFSNYQLFGRKKASLGYVFRQSDPFEKAIDIENRLTAQFAIWSYAHKVRIAHRFRAEQRFKDTGFSERIRYRLSTDFPINGRELDEGEAYFVASNESLLEIDQKTTGYENRLNAGIGWLLKNKQKIQFLPGYRIGHLGSNNETHVLIFNLAYYFRLS